MSTEYHSKYFAFELTKQCSAHQLEKLSKSIFNAVVDLNPHQLDAALFAFRSPLSRGAILADEVGLGKTIEAGLIISQLWAERKRKILCITPASLRKQWERELSEKFFIDSVVLESKNFNNAIKNGNMNPFEITGKAIICSYNFARNKEREIMTSSWDLVIVDEAHRLRNVYKKSNKTAKSIHNSIGIRPKILLTATPLQNSLMELYGLISFIDPHIFGSPQSFREQYMRIADLDETFYQNLRSRINPVCQRTLRRQVLEYIRYTNRISITQDFTPTDEENELYEYVSSYLQRDNSYALPNSQKNLITLVVRKILASSTYAISATFDILINRLENMKADVQTDVVQDLNEDYETADELQEEWISDEDTNDKLIGDTGGLSEDEEKSIIRKAIEQEVTELKQYQSLARAITVNAKSDALLKALEKGFQKLGELNAPQKALVFTESRRTQHYLYNFLNDSGYQGEIVLLNGTNTDKDSVDIYKKWLIENEGKEVITGSKAVDIRAALVDEFKYYKSIMIATESGAEGLNLQFCNLVVNYDLPWNPQRIEQRIGRCHRYGQKFDVVVINFLNRRNEADQRVFELLSEKLQLFDGVFGTSDEVLGTLEAGVDFEKRINKIYQTCRSSKEINDAFDALQTELEISIQNRIQDARSKLMENFDEDVHKRLKINQNETAIQINNYEKWLWELTKFELDDYAQLQDENYSFKLYRLPDEEIYNSIPLGQYTLVTKKVDDFSHLYRIGHPLAELILSKAKTRPLQSKKVIFDYSNYPLKSSVLESLLNRQGWLKLFVLTISAIETEDHLLFSAITDTGETIDTETCRKIFNLSGSAMEEMEPDIITKKRIQEISETEINAIANEITQRNGKYFEQEMEKLEKWSDDLKFELEQEIKNLDKEIKDIKALARKEDSLELKVEYHRKAKELEKKRKDKRKSLFEAQDEIDNRKETLISDIESKLKQTAVLTDVFTIKWSVI